MPVIPATIGTVIISIDYDGTGLEWARMFDNFALGWSCDETGATPPVPVTIGTLPPVKTAGEVITPQWCQMTDTPTTEPAIFVPDLYRGTADDFFTWLATNNGATRKLDARFAVSLVMKNTFENWCRTHSDLVYEE